MKFVINLVKRILSKEKPKVMGRWTTESCHTKINNKIDLSNEDHCGPCGKYALTKTGLSPVLEKQDKEHTKQI